MIEGDCSKSWRMHWKRLDDRQAFFSIVSGMVFQLDTSARAAVVSWSKSSWWRPCFLGNCGRVHECIAILKLILNLIGSQWRRINDDVTCSCLGNEHTNRTAAFCTRWSLLRFIAATPYNRLLPYSILDTTIAWTIDFLSSKLSRYYIDGKVPIDKSCWWQFSCSDGCRTTSLGSVRCIL